MDWQYFIFREGVLGFTIGTLLAFGATNYVRSIKEHLISPYLLKYIKKTRIGNIPAIGEVLASTIEFLSIILIIYLIYNYIVKVIFKKELKEQEKEDKQSIRREMSAIKNVEKIKDVIVDNPILTTYPYYPAP